MAKLVDISTHNDSCGGGLDGLPLGDILKNAMDQALNQALAEPNYNAALASMMKSMHVVNAICSVPMEVLLEYTKKITEFYQEKNAPKMQNLTIIKDCDNAVIGTNNGNCGPSSTDVLSPGNQIIHNQNNNLDKIEE